MPVRRPLCLFCLVFLMIAYVFAATDPPEIPPDLEAISGRSVTVKGTVRDRQLKNGTFLIYIKDVSLEPKTVKTEETSFPKTSKGLVIRTDDEDGASRVKIGSLVEAKGVFAPFDSPTCEGQFDMQTYYLVRGYEGSIKRARILGISKGYDPVAEVLRNVRDKAVSVISQNMDEKDAGLVAAMTLGDKTMLDTEIKELYQNAGISHVLALSGLHIASVGLAILAFLQKAGLSKKAAAVIAGSIIGAYAVMTGLSTSTVRAMLMFVLSVISVLSGRSYDLLSSAAASAVILVIVNPYYLYDTGFLLSFGAVVGISCLYPLFDNMISFTKIKNRFALFVYRGMSVSVSIMLATFTITGSGFMQIAVYSVVINLVVIPLMSMVLLTGFSGILVGFTPARPKFIFMITHYILSFYELLGRIFEKIPGNLTVIGKPAGWQKITYTIILIIAVITGYFATDRKLNNIYLHNTINRIGRHNIRNNGSDPKIFKNKITYIIESEDEAKKRKSKNRLKLIITLVMTATAIVIACLHPKGDLEIRNVDVGQGDCSLIWGEDIPAIMIDGGSSDVSQVGKYRIVPVLKANRVTTVDYCFLTHMDSDHVSGVLEMLEDETGVIKIKNVIISKISLKEDAGNENMKRLLAAAAQGKTDLYTMSKADVMHAGDLKIECLSPKDGAFQNGAGFDANDASLVLKLSYIGNGKVQNDQV
ncbi:MAG: ComEC/Rec2 family competence protein, partial [Lachnospiraceae bacterium]|nr:ComEC/Rec2 family competence protein [Lachnospiraceae bacterium]